MSFKGTNKQEMHVCLLKARTNKKVCLPFKGSNKQEIRLSFKGTNKQKMQSRSFKINGKTVE